MLTWSGIPKDQEIKERLGFVPYAEVVRLRRLCLIAWALVLLALILGGLK